MAEPIDIALPSSRFFSATFLAHLDDVWSRFGPLSSSPHFNSVSIDTLVVVASSFVYLERYTQAATLYQHCVARFRGRQRSPEPGTETQLFDLYDALGFCYMNKADYPSSESFLVKSVDLKTSVFGQDHPSTLNSMRDVGTVYRRLQKYDESAEMLEHVLAKTNDVRGPESDAYLSTANNLALVYRYQGRLQEALVLGQKTLETKLRCQGIESISTLTTMQCLGSIYRELGDDPNAEKLYLSALSGLENFRGIMHASTLRTASQLEKLYRRQGRTEDADKIWDKIQGDLGLAILQASRYGTDD